MVSLLYIYFALGNVGFLTKAFTMPEREYRSFGQQRRRIRCSYFHRTNNFCIHRNNLPWLHLVEDDDNDDDNNDCMSSSMTRIQRTLQDIGRDITQNKNVKEINLHLVGLGQEFNSFRKRFDFLALVSNENTNQEGSFWIRNNDENINVEEFIHAFKKGTESNEDANKLHIQSYHRIKSVRGEKNENEESQLKTAFNSNTNVDFQINTVKGISTSWSEFCSQTKTSWEGNKYITEYQCQNDGTSNDEQYAIRVERYLVLENDKELSTMKMIVDTSLNTIHIDSSNNNNNNNNNDKSKTIQCQEVFYPTMETDLRKLINDDDDFNVEKILSMKPLRSGLERVPGCIANVNIYTTLLPNATNAEEEKEKGPMKTRYHVLVDGETDTLLSRGLLSVLSNALSSLSLDDVLAIEPYTIANNLNLRSVLSAGRNDGLSNMVSIVQNQIRNLIDDKSQEEDKDKISSKEQGESSTIEVVAKVSKKPTVAVLLSGGVDSAVALNLLCQQEYDVTAFYLKIWLEDELAHLGQCPWEDDYNTCIEVCKHAGNVPLEAISLQDAYKKRVISYTIEEAKKGRTPNPDIMCNRYVHLNDQGSFIIYHLIVFHL